MANRSVTNNPGNRGSQPQPDSDVGNTPQRGQGAAAGVAIPATERNAEDLKRDSAEQQQQAEDRK